MGTPVSNRGMNESTAIVDEPIKYNHKQNSISKIFKKHWKIIFPGLIIVPKQKKLMNLQYEWIAIEFVAIEIESRYISSKSLRI